MKFLRILFYHIGDRPVNGLVGTVKQIKYKNNEVSVVYGKFSAGIMQEERQYNQM